MGYIVNGIAVGNSPEDIERTGTYQDFFESIGNSADNIKVISNFLSEEEIKYLLDALETTQMIKVPSQKDNNHEVINWMYLYINVPDLFKIANKVHQEVIKAYNFEKIKLKKNDGFLDMVKWEKGSKLNLHVDDLGFETSNQIATLVYLNDDYEGGEINFVTHDVCMKPKRGDLLIFPGNLNYPHEVKEILSGDRYTLPIWFTID